MSKRSFNAVLAVLGLLAATANVSFAQGWEQLKQSAMESFSVGDFLTAQGYWQDALNLAEHDVTKGDNYVVSLAGMAQTLTSLKRIREAEELYRKAVTMRQSGYRSQALDTCLREYVDFLHTHNREQEANELLPLFAGAQSDPNDTPTKRLPVVPTPSPNLSPPKVQQSAKHSSIWTAQPANRQSRPIITSGGSTSQSQPGPKSQIK